MQKMLVHLDITESVRKAIRQVLLPYDPWEMAEECEAALGKIWELKAAPEAWNVANEPDRDRVGSYFASLISATF